VVGEDVSAEELGGSRVHTEISGVADLEVADDRACIAAVKAYLSFFPTSNLEQPPVLPCDDPADRMDEALVSLVPDSARRAYDMKKVIGHLADHGRFFEIKPAWARNLITGLARMGGRPVGIVANQPLVRAGALDPDSLAKEHDFVDLCDTFGLPLVFLHDVPGLMIGSQAERSGILHAYERTVSRIARASVPRVGVVLRKAYGGGHFAMGGRPTGPDFLYAWPGAEMSFMAPETGLSIVHRRDLDASRRVRRHSLRAFGHGHRQGHD